MTFIEFKKLLLDAEITLPKFCKLIRVSDKNIQSYKKKGDIPNTIAVIATCFSRLHQEGIDYREMVEKLQLKKQTKSGGFKKKAIKPGKSVQQAEPTHHTEGQIDSDTVSDAKRMKSGEKMVR